MREIAQIKFAVTRTAEMEDRLIELEAMQKVLAEGVGQLTSAMTILKALTE
uniref:Uncharacterized protein n=1 Tax=Arundo donax TaxID=35708 RepID=A0A0A9D5E4_ARUDO